jgi:hypothetical protein
MDEAAIQVKVRNYPRSLFVNGANTWEEGVWSYPGRSVKLLPEGDAYPEGAMNGRDVITGFTEVSSGYSTRSPKQGRARHQKLRSKSETRSIAKKAENLPD